MHEAFAARSTRSKKIAPVSRRDLVLACLAACSLVVMPARPAYATVVAVTGAHRTHAMVATVVVHLVRVVVMHVMAHVLRGCMGILTHLLCGIVRTLTHVLSGLMGILTHVLVRIRRIGESS